VYASHQLSSVLHLLPDIESFDFGVFEVTSSVGTSILSGNKHLLNNSFISPFLSATSIIFSLTPSFSTSVIAVLNNPTKV
jgi:hypothetical protein